MRLGAFNWVLLRLGDAAQWIWHDAFGRLADGLSYVSHMLDPILASPIHWISVVANTIAAIVFTPLLHLPAWASNTLLSAAIGVFLLWAFKHTSNQRAIAATRNSIQANLLALKLFKDDLRVTLGCQGRLFAGAFRFLGHSLLPVAIMALPVTIVYAQLATLYEWRPLHSGEETLITMELNGLPDDPMPTVNMEANTSASTSLGPVRIPALRQVCWNVRAAATGRSTLLFHVAGDVIEMPWVAGEGIVRLSDRRPSSSWTEILLYPLEKPFPENSPVRRIVINYPSREGWAGGARGWIIYSMIVSLVAAFIVRPLLRVKI